MARILITSGPTREPVDPVRFLANASSGRMGAALAEVALRRGHEVDIVSGPTEVALPSGARLVRVTTALEMLDACRRLHAGCDVLLGAAAVSDYRPRRPLAHKRARGEDHEVWTLELVPNPDILAELGKVKGPRLHVGFALESAGLPLAEERARDKLRRKRLDWIVLNPVDTIGAATGRFWLIGADGGRLDLGRRTKEELAAALFERLEPALEMPRRGD